METLKKGYLFVGFRGSNGKLYIAQLPYEIAIRIAYEDNRFTIFDSSDLK